MKIGFVGIGKLGYPCALASSLSGHDVMGYDIDSQVMNNSPKPYYETAEDGYTPMDNLLERSRVRFGSLQEVVDHSEIVFVAVQTPHDPRYEGITRMPSQRVDFDYEYLVSAMKAISAAATGPKIVAIISTVLPGTIRREAGLRRQFRQVCLQKEHWPKAQGPGTGGFLRPTNSEVSHH